MERHYFKYKFGYINIDSENLYMTNSGNWQEALQTEEKSQANEEANNQRISHMMLGVYFVAGSIAFYIITMAENKIASLITLTVCSGLAFAAYNYMKTEFGKRYKIPLSKIQSVEIEGNNKIKINFLNANNVPDTETIKEVENKGINLLYQLNLLPTN